MNKTDQEDINFKIRNILKSDIPALIKFTDQWIGENYYTEHELIKVVEQSSRDGINTSFIALVGDKIVGARLTLAPGKWAQTYQDKISPSKWGIPEDQVAYFKSLFIAQDYQGKGLGKTLSNKSIEQLHKLGAQGIICHSWLESPNNSSQRYLEKMGFSPIKDHPKFWYEIDYQCTRCAPERCVCTAGEMLKTL